LNNRSDRDNDPWYRQFWPWFLIALPASVVVAGISMIFIAFEADSLVNDNYYREGMAINQRIEQDKKAREMGLSADVQVDTQTGELLVSLIGGDATIEPLNLLLLHPTDEKKDQALTLVNLARGYYRADLESRLTHRYYLRLLPASNPSWRLNGEINFSQSDQVNLKPQ